MIGCSQSSQTGWNLQTSGPGGEDMRYMDEMSLYQLIIYESIVEANLSCLGAMYEYKFYGELLMLEVSQMVLFTYVRSGIIKLYKNLRS